WSSDVCSSDLRTAGRDAAQPSLLRHTRGDALFTPTHPNHRAAHAFGRDTLTTMSIALRYLATEIYRASAIVLLVVMGLFTFFNLIRSEEHTSELQSRFDIVDSLLLENINQEQKLQRMI